MQLVSYVLLVVAALIPIANPFSTAPLFVSMTTEATKKTTPTYCTIILFLYEPNAKLKN